MAAVEYARQCRRNHDATGVHGCDACVRAYRRDAPLGADRFYEYLYLRDDVTNWVTTERDPSDRSGTATRVHDPYTMFEQRLETFDQLRTPAMSDRRITGRVKTSWFYEYYRLVYETDEEMEARHAEESSSPEYPEEARSRLGNERDLPFLIAARTRRTWRRDNMNARRQRDQEAEENDDGFVHFYYEQLQVNSDQISPYTIYLFNDACAEQWKSLTAEQRRSFEPPKN